VRESAPPARARRGAQPAPGNARLLRERPRDPDGRSARRWGCRSPPPTAAARRELALRRPPRPGIGAPRAAAPGSWSLHLRQTFRLVMRDQCVDDLVEGGALHHLVELVDGQVDAVLGAAALREVVGADALRPVAGADLAL